MSNGEVFIVDDDWAVGDALSIVLSLEGYQPKTFAEGQAFLAAARARTPACIILDVHMPGRSGLDILKDLNAQDYPAPILIISGQGDIPMAVEAIKHGAVDFIEKPFDAETVAREREVLAQIRAGASNREAGRQLGISSRTIEVHRARIMEKLGAKNAADLVRIVSTKAG